MRVKQVKNTYRKSSQSQGSTRRASNSFLVKSWFEKEIEELPQIKRTRNDDESYLKMMASPRSMSASKKKIVNRLNARLKQLSCHVVNAIVHEMKAELNFG